MDTPLTLTERELKEVQHAIYYAMHLNHGTVGHNMLLIIAKMALDIGFYMLDGELHVPTAVKVEG